MKSICLVAVFTAWAALAPSSSAAPAADSLFPDQVIARGKDVEVMRSQLENAYIVLKASMAAQQRTIPEENRKEFEARLVTDLVVAQILLSKAGDADKIIGREKGEKLIKETRDRAPSDEVLSAQLRAVGMSLDQFKTKVVEQAICREVMERELKPQVKVTDEDMKKFYDENPARFEQPEQVRAAHIMFSTKDSKTGTELPEAERAAKKTEAGKVLERVRKGEDFAALVKEFSEDPRSKDKGGEYTFARNVMSPPFEAAAFSLSTNQVSDIVTTPAGFHVIKCLEKIPTRKIPLDEAKTTLRTFLEQAATEKLLPGYFEKLKKDAAIEILDPQLREILAKGQPPLATAKPK